jgi:hypothetical protein
MKSYAVTIKSFVRSSGFRKWAKGIALFLLAFVGLILLASGGLGYYFSHNKTKIVSQINDKINENISGEIHIGAIEYKFLSGFPHLTLSLQNVILKDSLWKIHKRTFLQANEIQVQLNAWNLLGGEMNFSKVSIKEASLDLFTNKQGITNTTIFRKKAKSKKTDSKSTFQVEELSLDQLRFISENKQNNKLFYFEVARLKAAIQHEGDDWSSKVFIDTKVKSMAFNTQKGSFATNKPIKGTILVNYSDQDNKIKANVAKLEIGDDEFNVRSYFDVGEKKSSFEIVIQTRILWRNASNLLAKNISSRLNWFNLEKPLAVSCAINGDLKEEGDPKIVVTAVIKNDKLKSPGGLMTDCSFNGKFTNNFKEGQGFNDANSAVLLNDFSAKYEKIPFVIPEGRILNFDKPMAKGILNSDFDVRSLNDIIGENLFRFHGGKAKVNLNFEFDIVDVYLRKPKFTGSIRIKNMSSNYVAKRLTFEKTDLQLDFTDKALFIRKFKFKDRRNTIFIEGEIDDFLNLYYDAPEKMLVNWNIHSPHLDVKQFIGVLASTPKSRAAKESKGKRRNFSEQLHSVIDKCQVVLKLDFDRMVYAKLSATKAQAIVKLTNGAVKVEKGMLQTAGGSVTFSGELLPNKDKFRFKSKAEVKDVGIAPFLDSFNNFQIHSFNSKNINGTLSTKAAVGGEINLNGDLTPNSMNGNVDFEVNNGALIDFEPLKRVGKFAFPFRNLSQITFSDLGGSVVLKGENVAVNYLRVSSSVLNFDVNGVYSFGNATNLALTIPLRNSKNDSKLASKAERDAVRNKGIVLHLLAVDHNGKIKIKWGKNQTKEED